MGKYHIITMAKVGSASFLSALGDAEGGCLHYHNLTRFRNYLQSFQQDAKTIITGARNPVARNMSYFFQTFSDDFVNDLDEYCFIGTPESILDMNIDQLINKFFEQYWHATPLRWWSSFIRLCNINLNPEHFSEGFSAFKFHCSTIIVYRMEDLGSDINWKPFLPITILPKTNDSGQRWYSQLYRDFRKRIAFPKDYLDTLLLSPVTSSFYKAAEIESFYRAVRIAPRWF